MKRIIFYILTMLLALTVLSACGILPHETTHSAKQDVRAPIKSPDQPERINAAAKQEVNQLLIEQDYVGAIELIQSNVQEGIDEQVLAEEYLQAVNGSLDQAESLAERGDYSQAALLFQIVQKSYPTDLALQQQLDASPTELTDRIDLCSEKLMEEGLAAYRAGELDTAIEAWEQILSFNPEHQAAQNSIQTTQLQMTNLKSINKSN